MAASRLVYEFSASLIAAVPQLLPACLALLKATNREVVKAALGFVKVAVVRLAVATLAEHLDSMVPGLLLWEADTKNRFRAKVRAVLERLVRRLGAQAVAAAVPAQHAALVAHIRKEQAREERRRKAGGSQTEGGAGAGRTGARSERAPTRAASRWDADEVFSRGGGSARSALTNRAAARAEARMPTQLRLSRSTEPLDLMDERAMRGMLRSEGGGRGRSGGMFDDEDDEPSGYERAVDGRMVITEDGYGGRKRQRDGEEEEDRRSQGGASRATRTPSKSGSQKRVRTGASLHTAAAFRAKKGARGDVSHTGVQPYAYWSLDAKLLNRRAGRRREANKGLDKVVAAVKHAKQRGARK
jgi:ribosomal RNA-processing protein 12